MEFFQINIFVLLDKVCEIMLHLYHLQKMVFYNLSNSNSGTFRVFPALEKKDNKVFGENTLKF